MGPDPATVPPVFRWYGLVTAGTPLEQGDIFLRFPVLEPPTLSADDIDQAHRGVAPSLDADLKLYDLIVLSQSCDLQDMLPSAHVILCPLIDLRKATKADGKTLATPQEYGNLSAVARIFGDVFTRPWTAGRSLVSPGVRGAW